MMDPTKPASPNLSKINVKDDREMSAWSDKFDVTKVKLKAAINAVGASAKDVETYLKNR